MSQALVKSKAFKDVVQSDAVKNRLKEILGERGQQFAVALTQIVNGSYQLQQCEPNSILGAALTAASLNLSCDPNIGEAHLVPYNDKCQLQIGYKGFIQLAQRSGQYRAIGSTPVYEGELVSYDRLTGKLVLDYSKRESDTVIGYAAKFELLTGFERAEYWTSEEVERHAARYSKAYRFAKGKPDKEAKCLWVTDRDKMALKTVEKSLLNHYGPKSIEMQKAISVDGGAIIDADTGEVQFVDSDDEPARPVFSEPSPEPKDVTPKEAAPADNVASEPAPEPPKEQLRTVRSSPKTATAPAKPAPQPAEGGINKPKGVRIFLKTINASEEQLIKTLRDWQIIDSDEIATVDAIALSAPETLDFILDNQESISKAIGGKA